MNDTWNGQEVETKGAYHTQVWYATHKLDEDRLPLMQRSFISFLYGGKHIEDFNLIAITQGDSMERQLTADFSDLTTDTDVTDGQLYWGTHFKNNKLSLTLFTDEITEQQLTQFQHWFKPGVVRELILAEHPNRVIDARIATPPVYKMLPFEKKITFLGRQTRTTRYAGQISLEFTMDDPFWRSRQNFLEEKLDGQSEVADGKWYNPSTGKQEEISKSEEALKISQEDLIPFGALVEPDVLFGGDGGQKSERKANPAMTAPNNYTIQTHSAGAKDEYCCNYAYIGGRVEIVAGDAPTLANDASLKYYYAGTAPAPTILKFSFTPQIDDSSKYISFPANKYAPDNSGNPYSTLELNYGGVSVSEFNFTTPTILTAYNQLVKIFKDNNNQPVDQVELREKILANVNHYAIRNAALSAISQSASNSNNNSQAAATSVTMKTVLNVVQPKISNKTFEVEFNSKTGKATVKYNNDGLKTESAGDMVSNKYLFIDGRDGIDEVVETFGNEEITSYKFKSNHTLINKTGQELTNVSLSYRYMYY